MTKCDTYTIHFFLSPWKVVKIGEPYASLLEVETGSIGYAPVPNKTDPRYYVPSYGEIEVGHGTFREISKIEVGKHEAALDFLKRYGSWTRTIAVCASEDVASNVPIEPAKSWWVNLIALKRAYWLLETLTSDRIDDLVPLCIKSEDWIPSRPRIVDFVWPNHLGPEIGPIVNVRLLAGIHGYENEIRFGWKLLAHYINQCTPRNHSIVDFDVESGRLVEVPLAFSLLAILWRLLKERALRLKPTLRCHYSQCRKPIVNPSRSDTLCCPGSAKCRKGWQRDNDRRKREQARGKKE